MIARRRAIVAAVSVVLGAGAACGSFSDADEPAPSADAGGDASPPSVLDATPIPPDVTDAGVSECEVVKSVENGLMPTNIKSLAFDGTNVFAATTASVRKKALDAGVLTNDLVNDNPADDVIVTESNVAWRRGNGEVSTTSRTSSNPDASILLFDGGYTKSIEARPSNRVLLVRAADVQSCGVGGLNCNVAIGRADVIEVVARPNGTSFDFLGPSTDGGVAVYECASSCDAPAQSNEVALAGIDARALASDDTHFYWIDTIAQKVRRKARAGGPITDVMTDLVRPLHLGLDGKNRVVVGTEFSGVFRAPKDGSCRAPAGTGETIDALVATPDVVLVASGRSIRVLDP